MPKAAIDENNRSVSGKNNVQFVRKVPVMESVAEATREKRFSQNHFDVCILATNVRHHPTARRFVNYVDHRLTAP
jgi:hypothetical protein